MDIKLSDITQRRAEMLGEVGQAWVKALPDKVRQALADYGLTFVDSLPGGSASYLAIVTLTLYSCFTRFLFSAWLFL